MANRRLPYLPADAAITESWLRLLVDMVNSTSNILGDNRYISINETAGGRLVQYIGPTGGKAGVPQQYVVKEEKDDILRCHSYFDGTTEGTADVYIAKLPHLQRSRFDGRTIRGAYGYTPLYTYSAPSVRLLHDTGNVNPDVTERIVPPYNAADVNAKAADGSKLAYPGDSIYAQTRSDIVDIKGNPINDPSGNPVTLMEAWSIRVGAVMPDPYGNWSTDVYGNGIKDAYGNRGVPNLSATVFCLDLTAYYTSGGTDKGFEWSFDTGQNANFVIMSPDESAVYVGAGFAQNASGLGSTLALFKLRAANTLLERQIYRVSIPDAWGGRIGGIACDGAGHIFVACGSDLYCFDDSGCGRPLWHNDGRAEVSGGAAPAFQYNSVVYGPSGLYVAGANFGAVRKIDSTDGSVIWTGANGAYGTSIKLRMDGNPITFQCGDHTTATVAAIVYDQDTGAAVQRFTATPLFDGTPLRSVGGCPSPIDDTVLALGDYFAGQLTAWVYNPDGSIKQSQFYNINYSCFDATPYQGGTWPVGFAQKPVAYLLPGYDIGTPWYTPAFFNFTACDSRGAWTWNDFGIGGPGGWGNSNFISGGGGFVDSTTRQSCAATGPVGTNRIFFCQQRVSLASLGTYAQVVR